VERGLGVIAQVIDNERLAGVGIAHVIEKEGDARPHFWVLRLNMAPSPWGWNAEVIDSRALRKKERGRV
jgi:hypothetical protein